MLCDVVQGTQFLSLSINIPVSPIRKRVYPKKKEFALGADGSGWGGGWVVKLRIISLKIKALFRSKQGGLC